MIMKNLLFSVILTLVFSVLAANVQAAAPYQAAVLADPNLISYYPVDADPNASVFLDVVGTNDGVLAGTGSSHQASPVGDYALDLAGTSWVQFGVVPAFEFPSGSGTVECLVKKTAAFPDQDRGALFISRCTTDPESWAPCRAHWCLDQSTNSMNFDSNIGATWYNAGNNPFTCNVDQWYHLAIVYDAGEVSEMYVDGVALGAPSGVPLGDTGATTQFGSWKHASAAHIFTGLVDELAIYDAALSQSTLQDHVSKIRRIEKAYDPVPVDGGGALYSTITELGWTLPVELCDGDDLTVDVLFGTDPNLVGATKIVDGETNATSTTNFTVAGGNTYYWRVDVDDPDTCGGSPVTLTGDIWSFSASSYEEFPTTPYQDAVLAETSLISYYPVDPQTAVGLEDVFGLYDGTAAGSGASLQTGGAGTSTKCLELTADSWVNFGAASAFDFADGSGTVECLIKKKVEPAAGTTIRLLTGWGGEAPFIIRSMWALRDATMCWDARLLGPPEVWDNTQVPFTCNVDQWYHIAIVYDAGAVSEMYINGVAGGAGHPLLGDCGATYQFGALQEDDKSGGLEGLVDELAFYGDALSASTIMAHVRLSPVQVTAYDPSPANGASGPRASFTELSWSLPPGLCRDALTVDVLFGTDPTMATATKIVDGGTNTTSTTNFTVVADQPYYWRVDVSEWLSNSN